MLSDYSTVYITKRKRRNKYLKKKLSFQKDFFFGFFKLISF